MAQRRNERSCGWQDLELPLLDWESGLYRPELLRSRLVQELVRAGPGGPPVAVVLVQGEPTFRRRLKAASVRAIAGLLASVGRPEDVPARLRPRLFALLLPGVEEPAAQRIARAIALELHVAMAGSGDRCHVSCLGYPGHRRELEELASGIGMTGRRRRQRATGRRARETGDVPSDRC